MQLGPEWYVFFLFFFFSEVLVMDQYEKWELVVAGSTYGGRDFGPCSYPSGGLEIKQNHHHHHAVALKANGRTFRLFRQP